MAGELQCASSERPSVTTAFHAKRHSCRSLLRACCAREPAPLPGVSRRSGGARRGRRRMALGPLHDPLRFVDRLALIRDQHRYNGTPG